MAETRQSLTEKVAALEDTVVGTVQSATTAVADTVQTVKDAVGETVGAVKDNVAKAFDVTSHVRANPWAALGMAAVGGFITGIIVFRRPESQAVVTPRKYEPATSPRSIVPPESVRPTAPGVFDALLSRVGDEVKKLGEIVIEKVTSELHRVVDDGVPRIVDKLPFVPVEPQPGESLRKAC